MADGAQGVAAALEELLAAFGRGIGEAQMELTRSSIRLQREIDADPELSQHGVTATWYQIPSAEMEFKVALSVQSDAGTRPSSGRFRLPFLKAQPLNAAYQNQFKFDATAASTMRVTVLPVPAPRMPALEAPPKMTSEAAIEQATPLLERESGGRRLRSGTKVMANFQVASRTWYVVQYAQTGEATTTVAIVDVDDATGQARKRPQ